VVPEGIDLWAEGLRGDSVVDSLRDKSDSVVCSLGDKSDSVVSSCCFVGSTSAAVTGLSGLVLAS